MDISCVCFILLSSIRASTIRNFFEGFSIGYFTLFSPQFGTHKQLFLGETLIFGRYTYFWAIHLFLGDTLIFGRYTYFWVIHLFLGDTLIFGLYTYFWAIHLFLGNTLL